MRASRDGRNFAVAGGVAKSVVDVIAQMYPDKEIRVANAEGLKECKKLLQLAKAGKYNGYLLEGMACRAARGSCRNNAAGEEIPDGSLPYMPRKQVM